MNEEQIEQVIQGFLNDFNEMCKSMGREHLIRERTYNYESGPRTTKRSYKVTYVAKKRGRHWKITGKSEGFWIFRRTFPLFKIMQSNDKFTFKGLYVKNMTDFGADQLKEKLDEYLNICKNLPHDVFVNT